jgi:acylphosphatase
MQEKVRAHIFVEGFVQGVFFRANTFERAKELQLTGWVRNLPDGRVEILVEGEKEKVEKLIEWAKIGPSLAKVENVQVEWEKYQGEFEDFEIRYS